MRRIGGRFPWGRYRHAAVWSALLVLAALAVAHPARAATGNILLLLADDFGVDLARFYPVPDRQETTPPAPATPNLAAFAQKGLLFRRVWAAPSCSPTRAGILTGRYGFRTGIGEAKRGDMPVLALDEVTLPELFRSAAPSYLLAHMGKWHLSDGLTDPNLQGWTRYAGLEPGLGGINYNYWKKVVDGATSLSRVYAPTDMVNDTLNVIGEAGRLGRPYFAWVAFNAPHGPFHKPPNELHARGDLPATGAPNRAYLEAMVEALDSEIGRLLQAVDLATTTVIFVGDNGMASAVVAAPYDPLKAKGEVYQAGVQVPLLIAGQAVRKPGRAIAALVQTTDLFPTILQLAGIEPAHPLLAGVKTDGISLMPYLQNRPHPAPRRWLYAERFQFQFDGDWHRSIRNFQFALIERHDGSREFYNLQLDPLQLDDLMTRSLAPEERRALTWLDSQLDAIVASR